MTLPEPKWVSRRSLDAIHAALIDQYGGSHGIRDEALIESALNRPVNRYHYGSGADLAEFAAAYGFGIAKNHGYIDGNKRAALAAMAVFLRKNSHLLDVPEPDAVSVVERLAAGLFTEAELADWVRRNLRAL